MPSPAQTLPSVHHLRAALRAARLIDVSGSPIEAVRLSYRHAATDGIYRFEDLVAGESVLLHAGLLWKDEAVLRPAPELVELAFASDEDGCEALIHALLVRQHPLWLDAALGVGGEPSETLIPDGERRVLDTALDPAARERLLLRLARTFDDAERRATGGLTEEHVVARCRTELRDLGRQDLVNKVRRVSQISDQLGYDITAPRLDGGTRRIECKGTRGQGEIARIFLSRSEAERGLADPMWSLVVCRVYDDDAVEVLGWCAGSELQDSLPQDASSQSRWASVEIELTTDDLEPGLPPI